jgi:hypothetical protein
MFARLLTAVALATAFAAGPALAADEPAKKQDTAAALLEVLFQQEVQIGEGANVNEIPLFELLMNLSKRYAITFVIQEELFRAAEYPGDIKEAKPRLAATNLRGLKMHNFLTTVLEGMDAAYMVKGAVIEIVPKGHAMKLAGAVKAVPTPVVSLVVKEKPLNEAVATLAERYDLNVVVSPQAGDAKTAFVTARLLNIAADDALEMLAVQADLRVVRKGNAFLVTSRDHANELFGEKLEKERQQIELDKFRAAPPPKPQPEPKDGQPPGVLLLKGAGGLEIPLQIKPEPKPEKMP